MEKIILITGATSDVGMQLVKSVYYQYDKIICHYCHSDMLINEMKKNLGEKIVPMQGDFSDPASVKEFAKKIDEQYKLTHVVHLPAPKYKAQKFVKSERDFYEENMQVQFYSILEILHKTMRNMAKQNYGRVVFMLSSCTEGVAPKYLAPYVSTKYALMGLMKAIAAEYVGNNISVNGISPGMMDTKFLSETADLVKEMQEQNSSKGCLVDIQSVVSTIQLLLSDEAEFITGKNIVIDGEA